VIYILRSLYELFCNITGQWWFSQQQPLNLDPIPATISNDVSEDEVTSEEPVADYDDGTPLPPATGSDKPVCKGCGDPNFSLEKEYCIACRIGMP
jgi:hypothetical protein